MKFYGVDQAEIDRAMELLKVCFFEFGERKVRYGALNRVDVKS